MLSHLKICPKKVSFEQSKWYIYPYLFLSMSYNTGSQLRKSLQSFVRWTVKTSARYQIAITLLFFDMFAKYVSLASKISSRHFCVFWSFRTRGSQIMLKWCLQTNFSSHFPPKKHKFSYLCDLFFFWESLQSIIILFWGEIGWSLISIIIIIILLGGARLVGHWSACTAASPDYQSNPLNLHTGTDPTFLYGCVAIKVHKRLFFFMEVLDDVHWEKKRTVGPKHLCYCMMINNRHV